MSNKKQKNTNSDNMDNYSDTSDKIDLVSWFKKVKKTERKIRTKLDSCLQESIDLEYKENNINLLFDNENLIITSLTYFSPEQLLQFTEAIRNILINLNVLNPNTGETNIFSIAVSKSETEIEINTNKLMQYKVKELIAEVGEGITKLAYVILFKLCSERIYLCMNDNSKDSLYIALGNLLEKEIVNHDQLEDSIDRQSKILAGLRAKKERRGVDPNEMSALIYEHALKVFKTNDIKAMLIKAMYNDLPYIAMNADNRLTDDYREYLEKTLPLEIFINEVISTNKLTKQRMDSYKFEEDKIIENFVDIKKLYNWINSIVDEDDRKIAELHFLQTYSLQEIAEELNSRKSTIQYRVNKLIKNKPF